MSRMDEPRTNPSKPMTVRVPADLLDEFDQEVDNRSERIRQLMRSVVERDPGDDSLAPPHDDRLAAAYRHLCSMANSDGLVSGRRASRELAARMPGVSKDTARDPLRKLEDRGYIVMDHGQPLTDYWAVRVRPFG